MFQTQPVEIDWIVGVLLRRLWLILACALLAGVLASAVVTRVPPAYEATAVLLVESQHDENSSVYNDLIAGERLALTYSQLLKSQIVLAQAIERLNLPESPPSLAKRISVETVANTQLIRITATDSVAAQAALIADALAESFAEYVKTLPEQRFRPALASLQAEMSSASAEIRDVQAEIAALTARRKEHDAEAARLAVLLADSRAALRTLQNDHANLRMALDEAAGSLRVIEAAQGPAADQESPHSASVILLANEAPLAALGGYSGGLGDGRLAATYAAIVKERFGLEAALASAEIADLPDMTAGSVQVEQLPGTQLIRITVTDADGATAARLANGVAAVLIEQMHVLLTEPYAQRLTGLQQRIDALQESIDATQVEIDSVARDEIAAETELAALLSAADEDREGYRLLQQDYEQLRQASVAAANTVAIVESAQTPEAPASRAALYVLLAAVIGGAAATGIAFVLANMDSILRTAEDVAQALGLDPIAAIGRLNPRERLLAAETSPHSPAAEAFGVLAANVRVAADEGLFKTLLVTSPMPGEGKSTVVANLAVALARTGFSVTVVDADLQRPQLRELFGLGRGGGIVDALANGCVERHLQEARTAGVKVLAGPSLSERPSSLANPAKLSGLLARLAAEADLVLIDSPPVLGSADALLLASHADAALMVVRADRTADADAQEAMKALRRAKTGVLGVVLNAANLRRKGRSRPYRQALQEVEVHVEQPRHVSTSAA
jgi:non-specific protein-tyrosine kinase